ncbi:hypothetical protein AB0C12_41740 [Actinoplanes sp. NPDC048967]|uniref:hypothetical protein n=1 Tax=Actinoplanes sp. NPDC048967 TaxID=3155269 RepID=UPI0034012128
MRIRTAVSAALVSLAAVITMVVAGPDPVAQPEAAQSLVIVTEPDDVPAAWAAGQPTRHSAAKAWDCPQV